MSSSAEDEEENYWPGYVDALSTMTMVLTFVMMILVVVVFQLIQNTSRSLLERIVAEADVGGGAGTTSVESLSKMIVEAITTARESGTPPTATAEKVETQQTNVTSIAVEEETVINSEKAPEVRDEGQQTAVTVSQSALTVKFNIRATKLDAGATEAMKTFAQGNDVMQSDKTIEIIGFADISEGQVSDARRIAYYRAMVARTEMVNSGIDPARIKVGVRDTEEAGVKDTVKVFAR
jgi:hypothetical protein